MHTVQFTQGTYIIKTKAKIDGYPWCYLQKKEINNSVDDIDAVQWSQNDWGSSY